MAYIALESRTSSALNVYIDKISDINSLYEDYENDYKISEFSFVFDWYTSAPITDSDLSVSDYHGSWAYVGSQRYSYDDFQTLVYYSADKNKTDIFKMVDFPPQSKIFIQCVVYVCDSNGVLNKYAYRGKTGKEEYYQTIFQVGYQTDEAPINFSSRTPNSISVYISNLDSSYDNQGRQITWIVNGIEIGTQNIANQISESPIYTISGLEPGRQYGITYKMLSAHGYTSCDLTSVNYWTAGAPYIRFESSDETSITARLIIPDNPSYNDILSYPKIKWYYSTTLLNFSSNANYIDTKYNSPVIFTNLVSSVRYYFKCEILSSDESQSYYTTIETRLADGITQSDGFVTTDNDGGKPHIEYVECTNSSITVNVTNTEKEYADPYVVEIIYSTDTAFNRYANINHNLGLSESIRGYTDNISLSGLTANTTYYIKCKVYMNGQYKYESDNYITVTTAKQDGSGGGLGDGGGSGDITTSKPVIQILERNNDYQYITARLSNITVAAYDRHIHWFLSTSNPVSLTSYDEYGHQVLSANSTMSEDIELTLLNVTSTYYVYCLITNSAIRPASKNDNTVLISDINTVCSQPGTSVSSYYLVGNFEGSSAFSVSEDYLQISIDVIIYDRSTDNVLALPDPEFGSVEIINYELYVDGINVGSGFQDDNNVGIYDTFSLQTPLSLGEHKLTLVVSVMNTNVEVSKTIIVDAGTTLFSWTTNVQTGAEVKFDITSNTFRPITAWEWNEFCSMVNYVRVRKGLNTYNFTQVSAGTLFTKAIYNQAVAALNDMLPSSNRLIEASNSNVINATVANTYLVLSNNLNNLINTL